MREYDTVSADIRKRGHDSPIVYSAGRPEGAGAICRPQVRGIFALFLLILCVGLTACSAAYFEPVMTDGQLRRYLKEIYHEDFEILSSEPAEGDYVERGRKWTVCPADNPDMVFSVTDSISRSTGPVPFVYFHRFSEGYGTLLYREKLEAFTEEYRDSRGGKILLEKDEIGWGKFVFSEDTIGEQLPALVEYVNGLNREFPFYQEEVSANLLTLCYRIDENEIEQTWRTKEYAEDGSLLDTEAASLVDDLCRDMAEQQAFWLFAQKFMTFAEEEGIPLADQEDPEPNQHSYDFRIVISPETARETVEKVCDFVNSRAQEELFGGLSEESYRMRLWFCLQREGEDSPSSRSYGYFPFDSSAETAPYLSGDPEAILSGLRGAFGPDVLDSGAGSVSVPERDPDADPPVIRYNPDTGTRIISGDKITIDGDRIIVENDGEEIIIDGETSDLSAAGQGFPVSVPARLFGMVGRECYSLRL